MRSTWMVLALALAAGALAGAAVHQVKLAGGRNVEGELTRLQPGLYLLHGGGELLELSEDEISSVDGKPGNLGAAARGGEVRPWQKYEELQADGRVVAWDSFVFHNEGRTAITEVGFGIAPHEAAGALAVDYFDGFGNKLATTMEPDLAADPSARRRQLTIHLQVPVAPGESATLASRRLQPGARRAAEGLSYSFAGDFPDDRLVWRKVRLPKGAEILSVEPAPTARFSQDGHTYVMWRRFYRAGEVAPATVAYRLP